MGLKGVSVITDDILIYGKTEEEHNQVLEDPLLLIRKCSLCGDSGFLLKKHVTMTICLMSNSRIVFVPCAFAGGQPCLSYPRI